MRKIIPLISLICLTVLIASCNLPSSAPEASAEPDTDPVQLTIEAINIIKTNEAENPTGPDQPTEGDQPPQTLPTLTPETINPSDTPQPTFTDIPTSTKTKLPTLTPTSIPCDRASFVSDVTVSDNKEFLPGDSFTKTWRLKNNGSCTWTSGYKIIFDHGDQMGGTAEKQLTAVSVAPGQTVDISVNMIAPAGAGTYQGFWKLKNPQGDEFGIGAAANVEFWVKIKVVLPTLPPPVAIGYDLFFDNVHNCGSLKYATIRINNWGTEFFQSAWIVIEDITDSSPLYPGGLNNTPFLPDANDCPPANSDLDPGETYYIAASIGSSPTSGNTARYTVNLCTEDDLNGACIEKSVDFVIP